MRPDGSKRQTQRHFPEATCILDWPHLWRTMAKAMRAVGLQREVDPRWVERQLHQLGEWLWKGEVQPAEALLQRWQEEQKGHPAIKALTAALTYLKSQRDWIGNYAQWRRQGYPVGSGLIDSKQEQAFFIKKAEVPGWFTHPGSDDDR